MCVWFGDLRFETDCLPGVASLEPRCAKPIRGGNSAWPADKLFPRPRKVVITYHPVFHVEQRPDEEARACARRETERLGEILRSAL